MSTLPRRRARPRRLPPVTCSRLRCNHRPAVLGLCKTHATREADRLYSLAVRARDGRCRACGSDRALQCAHIVSRRYHATRWLLEPVPGAVTLCASCHTRYTHDPLAWEAWCDAELGEVMHDAIKYRARTGDVPDLDDVIEGLRARLGVPA